ncbi:ADP-forming succinate--CoA ligase subunit beta [Methylophilaceae bacterium]|nr:ADP-forming succinate--CoA ligase subunit beta [Methylophilaceae bacterium]|tara:strand:+ start:915 stop:2081 length:1167 start_codon:yes stop_codon:yes gene_type:complete
MNLHEYQAKELLKANGIKVPKGQISNSIDETFKIAKHFNSSLAIKAQIHAGGRGKAGGIKIVNTPQEAKEFASIIIGKNLITDQNKPHGQPVNQLLIEETISIKKEMYFSILIDRQSESIVIMGSQSGGMDIEEIAKKEHNSIVKEYCKINTELSIDQINNLAIGLGLEKKLLNKFEKFITSCFEFFKKSDLSLLEINPLAISNDNEIIVVDCKISLDDNAKFRHTEISEAYDWLQIDKKESEAFHSGLSYIALEGNIGCMVNGAGLAMATMDLIKLSGGFPANFLDVGGGATSETVSNAFKILLSDKNVKVVLVNIFGGIMRCDIIAEGIISAVKDVGVKIPIVVRLEGTNVDLGKKILNKSNLNIISADSLTDAAKRSVELTTLKK